MQKTPKDTCTTMSEMVLPNDTNTLGNLLGGRLMYWMDIAAVIAAMKHSNCPVVTVSADSITFEKPAHIGDIITIEAIVTRAFNSSIEVYIKVFGENLPTRYKYLANEAYLTFVALDPHGKPKKVPEIVPETEEEKKLYDEALQRRQMRLLLAGRIKPEDATELKKLYK